MHELQVHTQAFATYLHRGYYMVPLHVDASKLHVPAHARATSWSHSLTAHVSVCARQRIFRIALLARGGQTRSKRTVRWAGSMRARSLATVAWLLCTYVSSLQEKRAFAHSPNDGTNSSSSSSSLSAAPRLGRNVALAAAAAAGAGWAAAAAGAPPFFLFFLPMAVCAWVCEQEALQPTWAAVVNGQSHQLV